MQTSSSELRFHRAEHAFPRLNHVRSYYFDLISYVGARRRRLQLFKEDTAKRQLSGEPYEKEWASYAGRERALLRKRRTKLRLDAFHIIVQVGQGGYGEVYLARKKDTQEVVALKKMKKRTLAKMDEIRHVLVERDILTATKSPWLVALLYAFQDPTYIYLCMVRSIRSLADNPLTSLAGICTRR